MAYIQNRLRFLVLFIIFLSCYNVVAQEDRLSFGERFSVHTNVVDWAIAMPNIGFEMDLSGKPSTSHSLGVHFKYRPELWNEWSPSFVFNTWQIRGEYRHYWRTFNYTPSRGKVQGRHFYQRDKSINPVSSYISYFQRRYLNGIVKGRPRNWRAYYFGIYGEADRFTYLFQSTGHQGKGFGAGVSFGYSRPLYPFATGASIDLDLGISVGARMEEYDEFKYEDETHCYAYTGHSDRHIVPYPVLADAHVSIVYRFGSISRKVLGRLERFTEHEDSASARMQRRETRIHNRKAERDFRRDSIAGVRRTQHLKDSVERVQRHRADSLRKDSIVQAKAAAKEQKHKAKQNADSTSVVPTDSVVTTPIVPIVNPIVPIVPMGPDGPIVPTQPTIYVEPTNSDNEETPPDEEPTPVPDNPEEQDNPASPETPDTPSAPDDEPAPESPEEQDAPAAPASPEEEPATPVEPAEEPETPETPAEPAAPETPTSPDEETDE